MPSPPFRAAGTPAEYLVAGGPVSVNVSVPSGVVNDDFLLLIIRTAIGDSTPTPPGGWTAIDSFSKTSVNAGDFQLYYRIANSEPSSYAVSNTGNTAANNQFIAQILAWESATFDTSAKLQAGSGSTSITCPGIEMSGTDRTLICVYGQNGNVGYAGPYTAPSGMTERADASISDGSLYASFSVADVAVAASGATGTKTATATDGSTWHEAISIGIASAGGGGVTINGVVGDATAAGPTASVTNTSTTTTINGVVGNSAASGSTAAVTTRIMTDPILNNTDTILISTAVHWSWIPAGRVGSLNGITITDGTGTTDANGRLAPGITRVPGILKVAKRNTDATDDDVYYQAWN